MNGPADVMIKSEGSNEMDINLLQVSLILLGRIDWRFSRFYHVEWLATKFQTEGGSVYREDRYKMLQGR
jgi:hypothetical protein